MIEENDLTKLVIEVDNELIQEGVEPFKRPQLADTIIEQRLQPGRSSILHHNQLSKDVNQIYSKLYRPTDLYMPPMHVGAFMFRDIFFPLRIPLIFGSHLSIKPIDFLTDVPEIQKRWLLNNQQTRLTFFDQVIDLMDFVYGLDDLEKVGQLPDKTIEWWYLAKQQLEAAAATVIGSFNKYVVTQNCCISTELLLKGALLAKGIDENILKDEKKGYGHKLDNLVNKTGELLPRVDKDNLLFVVQQLPDYVKSRYEAIKFNRWELGRFLMNTQFISGEILRQFSDRNFRSGCTATPDENWDLLHRIFPKQSVEGNAWNKQMVDDDIAFWER